MTSAVRIDLWSDINCPWCAIGRHRLHAASTATGIPLEIVPHAFELDPDAGPARPALEHLAERYGGGVERARAMALRVRELAARDGLLLRTDEALMVNTFDAHRLVAWAQAQSGVGETVAELLAKAHFERLADVSDHAALGAVAGEAGLDPDAARAMLATTAHAEGVRADEEEARHLGIRGVPFFIFDGRLSVSGAQETTVFAQALRRAADAGGS